MAQKNTKRQKKKSVKPLIALAVILVILIGLLFVVYKIKGPTHNMENLQKYFFLTENSATGTQEAGENDLAIVLEDTMLDQHSFYGDTEENQVQYLSRAFRQDGQVYVSRDLVYYNIDERFYWDSSENVLVVTNADRIIKAKLNDKKYTINNETIETDYPIVVEWGSTICVAMDFVDQFSSASYEIFEDPARVYIKYKTGPIEFCEVKGKTSIRIRGGIRSNVVCDVVKGERLQIINDLDDWLEVINEEGFLGFIQTRCVKNRHTEDVVSDYDEPEYTSLSTGGPINMTWHGIYNPDANGDLGGDTANATGLNVLSPTWYSLTTVDADMYIRSSADYVDEAHSMGCLVWALLDADSSEEGVTSREVTRKVLSSTSKREYVIETIMDDMISNGIDGLNVDLELVNSDFSDSFIEFIRELSVRCRKAGKYLTVDNYTPYSYNASCFHVKEQGKICDYVVIMGYDDYVGSGEVGPNASLPFLEESLALSEELVPAEKLIYGIPFYTRVWYKAGEQLDREEYGMNDAQGLVDDHGGATWDETLGYRALKYENYETDVYIWLEDEDSIDAKLNLFSQHNIAGVASWKLGQERSGVWNVIRNYY
ncbi:MAG: glycosyl hydrolase family 18 protein [Lachnospiraceae bacterium]|nr:glycosyl hydrolase family 18 protein [Lachnospiraceae bacterium]